MKYIVGLDLSLRETGYSIFDIESIDKMLKKEYKFCFKYGTIKTKELRNVRRLNYIKDEIISCVIPSSYPDVVVFIEGYAMGIRGGRSFSIGELGGVVKYALNLNGIRFFVIPPMSMKKFITGKGNCGKGLVMETIKTMYGIETKNDNEADAVGLAMMGYEALKNPLSEAGKIFKIEENIDNLI